MTQYKRTKILYLIDNYESEVGGTEQNLVWLLKNVPEDEFEKHFLVFSSVTDSDKNQLPIVPRCLAEEFGFGGKTWPHRIRETAKIIRTNEIELIHCVTTDTELPTALSVFRAGGALGRGVRILSNRRDIGYHWTARRKMASRLLRWFRPHYLANSDAAKEAAHRLEGISLDKIDVIRNPISETRLREGLESPLNRREAFPTIPDNARIIGMLASIRPVKDHPSLLRAAKLVMEKHPNTYFVMVGDIEQPPHHETLLQLSRELNIENNVIWYGPFLNPFRILPLFDIAVLSSHSESFSNAVLEYAAAARPIVASNVGGLGELVHDGKTGLLVPSESPEDLASALLRLLENDSSRTELGQNAKEFAFQNFSEQAILRRYIDLYRRLV